MVGRKTAWVERIVIRVKTTQFWCDNVVFRIEFNNNSRSTRGGGGKGRRKDVADVSPSDGT